MSQSEESPRGSQADPAVISMQERSPLDETLREGARQMLRRAIEAEVADYVEAHRQEVAEDGRRLVVRNGYARQRTIVTGVGTLQVSAPRVEDRRVDEQGCKFRFSNVLDKLPKSMQGKAKQAVHDIYLAESRQAAEQAFDRFVALYQTKFPKAVACLRKDRQSLLVFYGFPAEHWGHLRTTNPIESTFATVRLRQRRTKGCGSREASLTMAFMLARQAERHWRRLNGSEVIVHVLEGKKFKDGVLIQDCAA